MNRKVILVGNPNTGKTTLYNTLTKSQEKATNWHGVTVGVKSKKVIIAHNEFEIFDIPGIYSLEGFSNEEKIATSFLKQNKDFLIVNICDANNLQRNLKLTCELINLGFNVILAVNMYQEVKSLDYVALEKDLNIPIIKIDARNNNGVKLLKRKIVEYFEQSYDLMYQYHLYIYSLHLHVYEYQNI